MKQEPGFILSNWLLCFCFYPLQRSCNLARLSTVGMYSWPETALVKNLFFFALDIDKFNLNLNSLGAGGWQRWILTNSIYKKWRVFMPSSKQLWEKRGNLSELKLGSSSCSEGWLIFGKLQALQWCSATMPCSATLLCVTPFLNWRRTFASIVMESWFWSWFSGCCWYLKF